MCAERSVARGHTRRLHRGSLRAMVMLELVAERPNWRGALGVALTRPEGVTERRSNQDPWAPPSSDRPRRISDDLAWLRQAFDEPEHNGLRPVPDSAAVAAWEAREEDHAVLKRVARLRDRGVLDAAGFLVHGAPDELS